MGTINNALKAKQLAVGRRYSALDAGVADYQMPFTSVFDLNTTEIFAQAQLIPTASSPFSSSAQNNYYYMQDGTINTSQATTPPAGAILRYWYRHELTEAATNKQDVYYFLRTPLGIDVTTDVQSVSDDHVTGLVSNKYLTGSLASLKIAEVVGADNKPGYSVAVNYSSNSSNGIQFLQPVHYEFDYKTGVLQIKDSAASLTGWGQMNDGVNTTGLRVYITAVQYVGKTLTTKLAEIDSALGTGPNPTVASGNYISSSNANNIVSASNEGILVQGNYTSAPVTIANLSTISASFGVPVVASSFTGSLQGTASWATVAVSASITDNTGTNASYYPVFVGAAGNQGLNIDTTTLSYNPSTNILTTTASNAFTASNITNAFTNNIAAPANHIVVSKGAGQVSGSGNFAFDSATNILTIGDPGANVTISPTDFDVAGNTYAFDFGNVTNAIEITNAGNASSATITFNLSASFTAPTTFTNANTTTFDDQFILLASGSSAEGGDKDSGIVFEYGPVLGSGSALFFDTADSKRLAFRYSASVSDLAMTPQAYINMTFVPNAGQGISNTSDVDSKFVAAGGTNNDTMKGFMFVDNDGNIYIKA